MTLDKIYNNFVVDFESAISSEFSDLYKLAQELQNDFKPIFETIFPDYDFCVDVDVYNTDLDFGLDVDSVEKEYTVDLLIFTDKKANKTSAYNEVECLSVYSETYKCRGYSVDVTIELFSKNQNAQSLNLEADKITQKLKEPFIEILEGKIL